MKPVHDARARVLILGSMPGAASLAAKQYYAHPQNRFWDIVGELVGAGRSLAYPERLEALKSAGIALWDVIASCERPGSLDASIRDASVVANDISGLAHSSPSLRLIAFNGKAAERYFMKVVLQRDKGAFREVRFVSLPSTSPAHASMAYARKLEAWRKILPEAAG